MIFCSVAEVCKVMGISRKTFYSWKEAKPELAREIAQAENRREEQTRQVLYSSLKKRLDGYTLVEEKEILSARCEKSRKGIVAIENDKTEELPA